MLIKIVRQNIGAWFSFGGHCTRMYNNIYEYLISSFRTESKALLNSLNGR